MRSRYTQLMVIRRVVLMLIALAFPDRRLYGETLVFPPYGHSYGIRKATPAHLFMFFGPRTFFNDPQGLATAKMISRDDPATEKDDDEVVVYGVNSGKHELIYNTSMWTLALYGEKGTGEGQFRSPRGVACDERGNVYVVDSGNNRVVHLFNPERKVQWVKAFNGSGNSGGGLNNPSQVALTADGYIYVTDTGNRRIVRFDSTGAVDQILPPRGANYSFVDGPTTLAVADGSHRWSYYNSERFVFCADSGGRRVWKLGLGGHLIGRTVLPSDHQANYGAVDYYHNLLITDTKKHCVVKLDHDLKQLDVFGSRGKGDNQFIEPRGIAIWKRYGQTFIAEREGAQYYWVGTKLKDHKLAVLGDGRYSLTTEATECFYARLFFVDGTDTLNLLGRRRIFPGKQTTVFVGSREAAGKSLVLRVEPTYSSRTYNHWDYPVRPVR